MRFNGVLLISVFLCGYSHCINPFNSYIDAVVDTALQLEIRALSFDPLSLPDFETAFDDTVKIIGKVHGHVKYIQGQLYGLSLARRNGNCSGSNYAYGFSFINCTVELDNLRIVFKGKLKYGKLPTVPITAKANMSTTLVNIGISHFPTDITYLSSFVFRKIGQTEVKFSGLGMPLNKYMDVLKEGFVEHTWPAFFNTVGKNLQYALGRAIERVPLVMYQY